MKVSAAFPSNFLKAADLDGKSEIFKMGRVDFEKIGDDQKPILYFKGLEKGLVLNKTNSGKIAAIYGDEMDDWNGQEIVMFPAMVDFKGETVEAIRVRAPQPKDRPQRRADPISSGRDNSPADRSARRPVQNDQDFPDDDLPVR